MRDAIRKRAGDFTAIIVLMVIALGVGAYILSQERLRFPFLQSAPFKLKAELATAQAVVAGQGQTVRVSGVHSCSLNGPLPASTLFKSPLFSSTISLATMPAHVAAVFTRNGVFAVLSWIVTVDGSLTSMLAIGSKNDLAIDAVSGLMMRS